MPIYANVILIAILFLFNAIFAMYEIGMVSARRARLQQRAKDGSTGAVDALELLNDPNQQYLSTVQIMITLIDTLAGGIGGAMLAAPLASILKRADWLAPVADTVALISVVVVITYFSIVMGELIPKRMAVSRPEDVVVQLSPIARVLARMLRPLTRFLSTSTNLGIKLLRIDTQAEPAVTEDEIKVMIDQGREIGVFEEIERDMVSSIFRLGDRRVDTMMTPRTEIAWVDVQDHSGEYVETVRNSGRSCLPVARGGLDDVIGLVSVKDLLGVDLETEDFDIEDYVKPALFMPANLPALVALEVFRNAGTQDALVIDEYGGLRGMVTLHDVLEAIVGMLPEDIDDRVRMSVRREDGSWLFDGMIVIDELKEVLGLSALPEEERAGFQTLGGFIMSRLGSIPKAGQFFDWGRYRFEVVDMDGMRVDKVLVSISDGEENPEETV